MSSLDFFLIKLSNALTSSYFCPGLPEMHCDSFSVWEFWNAFTFFQDLPNLFRTNLMEKLHFLSCWWKFIVSSNSSKDRYTLCDFGLPQMKAHQTWWYLWVVAQKLKDGHCHGLVTKHSVWQKCHKFRMWLLLRPTWTTSPNTAWIDLCDTRLTDESHILKMFYLLRLSKCYHHKVYIQYMKADVDNCV